MIHRQQSELHVAKLLNRLNKAARHSIGTLLNEAKNEEDPLVQQFREIERKIQGMKDLILTVKRWEGTVIERCRRLEQEIDDDIFKDPDKADEIQDKLRLIDNGIEELKKLISVVEALQREDDELRPIGLRQQSAPPELLQSAAKNPAPVDWMGIYNIEERILAEDGVMSSLRSSYNGLESFQAKACCLFLSVFPEKSVIRKRSLIYWWIGEGLVAETHEKTASEAGEEIFRLLLEEGFLKSVSKNGSPIVNRCSVHPLIRLFLIRVAEDSDLVYFNSMWKRPSNGYRRNFLLDFGKVIGKPFSHQSRSNVDGFTESSNHNQQHSRLTWRICCFSSTNEEDVVRSGREASQRSDKPERLLSVYNINLDRLDLKSNWLSRLKMVEVLHLGRWQESPKHHIEIKDEHALAMGLGHQTHLKYLSLQGISRITSLPPSVAKLISLEILDLRACHNLERLPDDISLLRNLTHLDVSECYLLESMPKGLEYLSALQVLKGFLIRDEGKNPCTLNDLSKLKKLRKLSVRIQDEEAAETKEFADFGNFTSLRILVISWAVVYPKKLMERESNFCPPPNLQKLDLRCVPLVKPPNWLNPSGMRSLEKLYVRGGELENLPQPDGCQWNVRILRLKHLKNLRIDEPQLRLMFPLAIYMEKIKCNKIREDLYDPDITWCKTEEEENTIMGTAPSPKLQSSSRAKASNIASISKMQRLFSSFGRKTVSQS